MARIEVNKDHYVYCNVDDNPYYYMDEYNSSEECLKVLIPQVLEDIKDQNDFIKERVVNHYSITFNNYGGDWKDIYK